MRCRPVIGLLANYLVPDPVAAASLAVGAAIAAMFALRCLHPPGGAMALLVVLTHTHSPLFVLFPAFTNSALMVLFGIAYHALTRHSYPHVPAASPAGRSALVRLTEADFAAALAENNEILDISAGDLNRLLRITELKAYRRMAGLTTCADIMSKPPYVVHFGTHLDDAWRLMRKHDIKALPVVDRRQRVHGLLTARRLRPRRDRTGPLLTARGLTKLLERTPTAHSRKPEVAGQIMAESFTTAYADSRLEALLPLFSEGDRRHVVILDAETPGVRHYQHVGCHARALPSCRLRHLIWKRPHDIRPDLAIPRRTRTSGRFRAHLCP
ncbi:MAG: HPP family protein [Asticcacaulis sp.]